MPLAAFITLREATPADAEQIIALVQRITYEPDSMISWAPGEFQISVEEERDVLARYQQATHLLCLEAEAKGQIVGVLRGDGGTRQTNRHCASSGICISREWRNQGVATALKEHFIEWAKSTGVITRLETEVYAHNTAMIHLNKKLGFVEEGRRKHAYFHNGQFVDSILMARLL